MNQLERDYTYRFDAVKAICEPVDWEGTECATAQDLWNQNHAFNAWSYHFINVLGITVIVLVVLFLIPSRFYASLLGKLNKDNENTP